MSKFNQNCNLDSKFLNFANGVSYKNSDKFEVSQIVLNANFSFENFYSDENTLLVSLEKLVLQNEVQFIAKLALFARVHMQLRSIFHILVVFLTQYNNRSGVLRKLVKSGVLRVDDMSEIFSLWKKLHPNTMLPNSIRRAFRDVLESDRFDIYQLKKYAQKRKKVKLKDIVKIAHPSKRLDIYKEVIEDKLPKIVTLHTETSKDKPAYAVFLENAEKLGYMEILRRTRNIFESLCEEEISFDTLFSVYEKIILDMHRAKNSKVLAFRYYQTYLAMRDKKENRKFLQLLEEAFLNFARNNYGVHNSGQKVAILIDESGSMGAHSFGITLFEHAVLLASAFGVNADDLYVYFWAESCREIYTTLKEPFALLDLITQKGGGTYYNAPLEKLLEKNINVDKIIVLTDCQLYGNDATDKGFLPYFEHYLKTINPHTKILFWDLAGYGGTPIRICENVLSVSGFSLKMLEIIPRIWENQNYLIDVIEKMEL